MRGRGARNPPANRKRFIVADPPPGNGNSAGHTSEDSREPPHPRPARPLKGWGWCGGDGCPVTVTPPSRVHRNCTRPWCSWSSRASAARQWPPPPRAPRFWAHQVSAQPTRGAPPHRGGARRRYPSSTRPVKDVCRLVEGNRVEHWPKRLIFRWLEALQRIKEQAASPRAAHTAHLTFQILDVGSAAAVHPADSRVIRAGNKRPHDIPQPRAYPPQATHSHWQRCVCCKVVGVEQHIDSGRRAGKGIVEVSGSQWTARWQLRRELPPRPSPAFGSTTLAAARATEKPCTEKSMRALFDEMDTNRDGLVSLIERERERERESEAGVERSFVGTFARSERSGWGPWHSWTPTGTD